ncbi:MAG: prephenate dehydrogenase/arogenate dehydrogenase family protein [Pseudomonadota bacterium]
MDAGDFGGEQDRGEVPFSQRLQKSVPGLLQPESAEVDWADSAQKLGSQEPALLGWPRVGIIGGRGRMGRWLGGRLRQAGHEVLVADAAQGPLLPEIAAACPVLVLAVPIPAVAGVLERIGPHTRPDGVLLDIASLKAEPLRLMLEHARGEVIGTHPLFGPSAPDLQGQLFFVCPGRGSRWLAWLKGWLEAGGARVQEIDAQAHDRLMAQAQTLRHMLLLGLGGALMQGEFDFARDLPLAGPWFGTLISLLERQAGQPAELYADLALNNPHAPAVVRALAESLGRAASCLDAGDRDGLVAMLEQVGGFVGGMTGGGDSG